MPFFYRQKIDGATNFVDNLLNGKFVPPVEDKQRSKYVDVISPVNGEVIARCAVSTAKDAAIAVEHAQKAIPEWSKLTVKSRAAIMLKFHALMSEHAGTRLRFIDKTWCN